MGVNLYVASWNIGETSYIHILDKLGFKRRPAIILTDKDINNLSGDSFKIIIDNPQFIRDIPELTKILPTILDLILKKEYTKATKAAIAAQNISKLKSISKNIESVLNKVKLTISLGSK